LKARLEYPTFPQLNVAPLMLTAVPLTLTITVWLEEHPLKLKVHPLPKYVESMLNTCKLLLEQVKVVVVPDFVQVPVELKPAQTEAWFWRKVVSSLKSTGGVV
jgi:hypothetical protein